MANKQVEDFTTTAVLGTDLFLKQSTLGVTENSTGTQIQAFMTSAVEDVLTVGIGGQTAFTLSETPSGDAAFALYLNGQLRLLGTDYSRVGTALTWLDPGGLTLQTTDDLVARYNDAAPAMASTTKEIFYMAETSSNNGTFRVRSIGGTGAFRFNFFIPADFNTLVSLDLWGIPAAGAAGAGKDIDLTSEYGAVGEASNNHTETDTGTTYDLTGTTQQITAVLDLSIVVTSLAAGDAVGIEVDHNGIGGGIDYLSVRLVYTT